MTALSAPATTLDVMNDVDIFLPAEDTPERAEFLEMVQRLTSEGSLAISVFRLDEQPGAFQHCEQVRDMIEVQGKDILPITLIGADIMGIYAYPTEEKLRRFATVRTEEAPAETPEIGERRNLMGGDIGDGLPQ